MSNINICSLRTTLINYLKLILPYKSNIINIKILDLNINAKFTSQKRISIYGDYNLEYEYIFLINNAPKTIYKIKKINFSRFIFLPNNLKNIDLKRLTPSITLLSTPKTFYNYTYNNNLYSWNKEYKLYIFAYLRIELIKENIEYNYSSKLNTNNKSISKNKNNISNIINTAKTIIHDNNKTLNLYKSSNIKNSPFQDSNTKALTNNYQTQLSEVTNNTLLQYINFASNLISNKYSNYKDNIYISPICNSISLIENTPISELNIISNEINNTNESFRIEESCINNKNTILTPNIFSDKSISNNVEFSTNIQETNDETNYINNFSNNLYTTIPISNDSVYSSTDISAVSNKLSSYKNIINHSTNNISKHETQLIEANVIICKDEKNLFINKELTLPMTSKKIWRIEKITNTVDITKIDVSNNTIFIAGFIYTSINYKTLYSKISNSISGPLEYVQFNFPLSTYINIDNNYKIENTDKCQVISATCLSEIHKLINPIIKSNEEIIYDKILEQLVVNIKILISRKKIISIYFKGH